MSSHSWFSRLLLPWYHEAHRPLPWRSTRNPYRVWLSEVILQQTRVDQGLPYYQHFVHLWPSVQELAAAGEQEVLKAWQGLGYYSRARNLLAAARQVVQAHGGQFPDTHAGLLGLKGVGDYTAAAIASICFNRPEAVVDGNVYRVLARVFGIDTPIDGTAGRKRFQELAMELLDAKHPGDHNQAVMELGATVCMPKKPNCPKCPLQAHCTALGTGTIADLPVKQGKAAVRHRWFNYLWIADGKSARMQRRADKDIWAGLHEPPLLESPQALSVAALNSALAKAYGPGLSVQHKAWHTRQVLSHQVIHATFWATHAKRGFKPPAAWARVPYTQLPELPVPKPIERWLAESARTVE